MKNTTKTPNIKTGSHYSKRRILQLAGVAVLACVAGCFAYLWQQEATKADDGASKLSNFEKRNTQLTADIAKANATNATLTQTLKDLQQEAAKPTIAILDSKHFNGTPNQYNDGKIFYDGSDFVLINVSVTNTSNKNVALAIGDFKLKSGATVYPYYTNSAVGSYPRYATGVEGLPAEYIELKGQTLRPGEKVTGTLIFFAPETAKDFTLYFAEQTLQVRAV